MKAKEYYNTLWLGPGTSTERLEAMVMAFIQEMKDIANARNAKSDASIVAIVREQELKWKALMRMIPEVASGSLDHIFIDCLRVVLPAVYMGMQLEQHKMSTQMKRRMS